MGVVSDWGDFDDNDIDIGILMIFVVMMILTTVNLLLMHFL